MGAPQYGGGATVRPVVTGGPDPQDDTQSDEPLESGGRRADSGSSGAVGDPLEAVSGRQDLYIGLVRAIGTDLGDVIEALRICFGRAGYSSDAIHVLKLSKYFPSLLSNPGKPGARDIPVLSEPSDSRYHYYDSRMNAGDWARSNYEPGILAQCAAAHSQQVRDAHPPIAGARPGLVFVFDSLMHKKEVAVLRSVYGKRFFLVAVHSPSVDRAAHLLDELRSSDPEEAPADYSNKPPDDGSADVEEAQRYRSREDRRKREVEILMKRDEGLTDPDSPYSPAPPGRRVSIRKTFALADVFVSVRESDAARRADGSGLLERFVHKVFDEPFHTPTRDELGMAHAYVAARRSGSLARHVGAALCTDEGELLAVGTNEVPAARGGQYWPTYDGASHDARDHTFELPRPGAEPIVGVDSNDLIKNDLAVDFAQRLLSAVPGHLADESGQTDLFEEYLYRAADLIPALLAEPTVASAKLFDVIEYSRHVHAEMAALLSCARRGIVTQGAVLYCTTFPCHECSRHIIAAGISRVVYVEPYEKSRVSELHFDSVDVRMYAGFDPTSEAVGDRVRFEPFIGISPDRQADLYAFTRRKHEGRTGDEERVGRARPWVFGPRSPLRESVAADEATVGVAELMMVLTSERYIARALGQHGIDARLLAGVDSPGPRKVSRPATSEADASSGGEAARISMPAESQQIEDRGTSK